MVKGRLRDTAGNARKKEEAGAACPKSCGRREGGCRESEV